jgi:oxygen-independent coproporphyrinogen-3 oxidase
MTARPLNVAVRRDRGNAMSYLRAVALAARFPHDFTIQYPPRREFFQERYRGQPALDQLRTVRRLLLYIHVPFCEAKCHYCNFAVDTRRDLPLQARYVGALLRQLDHVSGLLPRGCSIPGIDIGGGTPTLLQPVLLERLLEALRPWRERAENLWPISIETTPRIAAEDRHRLALLARLGADRISLGLQSTSAVILAGVNRGEQAAREPRAVENLRRAGFRRVNVDLIFGLPGQTRGVWRADLDRALALPVDSVTTYDCLYRGKGRVMTRRNGQPPPEVYGELYDLAYERLTSAGFHAPYGSVNFSRYPGETGTSPYFEGRLLDGLPYLGIGNYASSLVRDAWWFAPYGVNGWLKAAQAGETLPIGDGYRLPDAEVMAKYLLSSLSFGIIDSGRFLACFGQSLAARFGPALSHAVDQGWLRRTGSGFGIVPGAFRFLPQIRSLFYSPAAIAWIEERVGPAGVPGDRSRLPLALRS